MYLEHVPHVSNLYGSVHLIGRLRKSAKKIKKISVTIQVRLDSIFKHVLCFFSWMSGLSYATDMILQITIQERPWYTQHCGHQHTTFAPTRLAPWAKWIQPGGSHGKLLNMFWLVRLFLFLSEIAPFPIFFPSVMASYPNFFSSVMASYPNFFSSVMPPVTNFFSSVMAPPGLSKIVKKCFINLST